MASRQSQVSFTVPGIPVAQARPRIVTRGGHAGLADRKDVKDYKGYFKFCVAENRPQKPYTGACRATVDIFVQKPASWPKKRVHAETKPDVDNFLKLIFDCMEGIVYSNDSRVVEVTARKHLSDTPRVEVVVEELAEMPGNGPSKPNRARVASGITVEVSE